MCGKVLQKVHSLHKKMDPIGGRYLDKIPQAVGLQTVDEIGEGMGGDGRRRRIIKDQLALDLFTLALDQDIQRAGTDEGDEEGGLINVVVAPAVGTRLKVTRLVDILQLTDLRNQGKFFAEVHEDAFDLFVMMIQQVSSIANNSMKLNEAGDRWDAQELRIVNVADPVNGQDATTLLWVKQYIGQLLETGQGSVNNASNVVYVGPDGVPYTVQDLSGKTDPAKGSALVGHSLTGSTGPGGTVQQKLVEISVSPVDFNGDLVAWAAHPASQHVLPAGNYSLSSDLVFPAGSNVEIAPGAVITGAGVMRCEADLIPIPNLSWNVAKGAKTLTFASDHGLVAGDVIRLWNTLDHSWSDHRTYYHSGEDFVVHAAPSPTTVTLASPALHAYTGSEMLCFKFDGRGFRLRGGTFQRTDSGFAVLAKGLVGVDVRPFKLIGSGSALAMVSISKCHRVEFDVPSAMMLAANTGLQYVCLVSNSTDVSATGNGNSTRHIVAIGGDADPGSIPSRHIRINNMRLSGVETTGADVHGNCEDIIYSACKIDGGALIGGKDVIYDQCVIGEWNAGAGQCVASGEVIGGYYKFIDCKFVTASNPRSSGIGLVQLNPSGANGVAKFPVSIEIIRPKCIAPNHIGGVLSCNNVAGGPKVGVLIDAPDFTECPAMANGVALLTGTGVTNWSSVIVRSPRGLPATRGYLDSSSAAIDWSVTPHEFPQQTGLSAVTGNGTVQAGNSVTFKHPYPNGLTPSVQVTGPVLYVSPSLIGCGAGSPTNTGFIAQIAAAASSTMITSGTTQNLRWTSAACTL